MNSLLVNSEIVMACLTIASQDITVLRVAQRKARELGIGWCAVYLELPEAKKEHYAAARNCALEQIALAERMGAMTMVKKAETYADGIEDIITDCAQREMALKLLVVAEPQGKHRAAARQSIPAFQKACKGRCEVIVLSSYNQRSGVTWIERLNIRHVTWPGFIAAIGAVVGSYVVTELLVLFLPEEAFTPSHTARFLIFLISSALVAGSFGLLPGLIASVSGFLALNFFYLAPIHSFQVDNPTGLINLGLFLIASVAVSFFNSRVQAEAEASETNERRMQALLQVYKIVSHARSRNEAMQELHDNFRQFLHAEIAIFLPSLMRRGVLEAVWPENPEVNERDHELLMQCWQEIQAGNYTSIHNPNTGWRFEPLVTAAGELGVLAIRVPAAESADINFEQYLRTIAELVASVLEKIESTDAKEEIRVRAEREKLRTSLLSSVSHDLKTPLAAVIGSLGVYRSMFNKLSPTRQQELVDTALAEAERLDSFITNILDMAKIESGAINFRREWLSPLDIARRVKKHFQSKLNGHEIVIIPSAERVEVEMDAAMAEQALTNVLDNAIKHTLPGTPIEITLCSNEKGFFLKVRDHGPGIPGPEQQRIFDKYTRLCRKDMQVAGTGLGLAFARAAMEGQGGRITVRNHPEMGAVFTLSWPKWQVVQAATPEAAA